MSAGSTPPHATRPAGGRQSAGARPPAKAVQPARRIAFEILLAVRDADAYANLLLPVKLERAKLNSQDAAFATELSYGTLRGLGYYDAVIEIAAGRPVDDIDAPILDVLRLGAHQLLSMRVASHAAVDESVSLAREIGSRSAAGFVNAVLRTITRSTTEQWHERVVGSARSEDERLSREYSHPVWIVRAFRQALAAEGREHELVELLGADNAAPLVSIAALPGLASPEQLEGTYRARFSPIGAVSDGGDPSRFPAVREGRARVQDEGSQLAALALSRARPIAAGERWLDLCAGPGGKAALLAAEATASGATLVANEVTPARAELVRDALAIFPDPPQVLVQDGTAIGARLPEQFDRILLDAPCTGLGALRRRPEARWRKRPVDVAELSSVQAALLASAVAALKPGGILAYVTCSPHQGETRSIVSEALARSGGELRRLDTAAVLGAVTAHPLDLGGTDGNAGGAVQLWPHRHGTDAMFICLIEKTPTRDQPQRG